jgi:hypothetical protein
MKGNSTAHENKINSTDNSNQLKFFINIHPQTSEKTIKVLLKVKMMTCFKEFQLLFAFSTKAREVLNWRSFHFEKSSNQSPCTMQFNLLIT